MHAPLAVDEDFEYSNPKGMCKGFEELCLEHLKLPNARRWLHVLLLIYEYNETRGNEYMFLTISKPRRRVCLSVGFTLTERAKMPLNRVPGQPAPDAVANQVQGVVRSLSPRGPPSRFVRRPIAGSWVA